MPVNSGKTSHGDIISDNFLRSLAQLFKIFPYEFSIGHFPTLEQYCRMVGFCHFGNCLYADSRAHCEFLGLRRIHSFRIPAPGRSSAGSATVSDAGPCRHILCRRRCVEGRFYGKQLFGNLQRPDYPVPLLVGHASCQKSCKQERSNAGKRYSAGYRKRNCRRPGIHIFRYFLVLGS